MARPTRNAAQRTSEKGPIHRILTCVSLSSVKKLLVQDNAGASENSSSTSHSEFSAVIGLSDTSDDDKDEAEMELSSEATSKRHSIKENKKIANPGRNSGKGPRSDNEEFIDVSDFIALSSDERELPHKQESRGRSAGRKKMTSKRGRKKASHKEDGRRFEWQRWEDDLENWGPWLDNEDVDLEVSTKKGPMDTKEPPPEMLMPLLPFQKEFLWWSLRQEQSTTRGGILADEMGMGKTIQAISLILASRAESESSSTPPVSVKSSGFDLNQGISPPPPSDVNNLQNCLPVLPGSELMNLKATLVVCPLVAVIQWRNEIVRFTREGSVKVLVYHGAKRCKDISELAEYDIILTTYAIVELEHRVSVLPAKGPCKWCNKLFYPDRLSVHQRYFCGPHARKTEKQAKQVKKKAPKMLKTLLGQKVDEVKSKSQCGKSKAKMKSTGGKNDTAEPSQVEVKSQGVRGWKRKIQAEELEGVLTEAMDSLGASDQSSKGLSILHAVKWNRVILDEAHYIKDRRCSTAKAVFALKSNFKWALSGTPLQNRVGELYSLVRFLEVKPFSYYYCKICDCKSLDYSFGKEWRKCDHCKHSPLSHFCWWNKYIANPIKKWGNRSDGKKAMALLKYKLLDSFLLRRTKLERAADLALPPRTKFLRRDNFDTREEDFYQALYTQSQSQFNTYITSGTLLNNYAHIFDLLTRLRQAVDHPYLVVYSRTAPSAQSNDTLDAIPVELVCGICNEPVEEAVTTACKHTFCKVCIHDYISAAGCAQAPPCPVCESSLTVDLTGTKHSSSQLENMTQVKGYKRSSILHRINLDEFQTSTKIDALREEIWLMLDKDCAAKAIVFSQFTSFLDLIAYRLEKCGITCVKLDGSMTLPARDQMIDRFTNDPDCKVFLMSLKAGGVALNLTVASHVFLMDPWWNPAVEEQAQDRIHRLGQYKPIRVVRFIIENTIEERILKLQEKKQLVFEGTVGGSSEALGRLTEGDLRFLFTS